MKRSTNRNILKYSLLPALVLVAFAVAFPEAFKGTDNPTFQNYMAYCLFVAGGLGAVTFWVWGVGANVTSLIYDPLQNEQKAGRLKPGSYEERTLRSLRFFRLLNIYIDRE
ncbi:MAG: hypothetical protein ACE37E_05550 [Hyphomicrobiales bacterium]